MSDRWINSEPNHFASLWGCPIFLCACFANYRNISRSLPIFLPDFFLKPFRQYPNPSVDIWMVTQRINSAKDQQKNNAQNQIRCHLILQPGGISRYFGVFYRLFEKAINCHSISALFFWHTAWFLAHSGLISLLFFFYFPHARRGRRPGGPPARPAPLRCTGAGAAAPPSLPAGAATTSSATSLRGQGRRKRQVGGWV